MCVQAKVQWHSVLLGEGDSKRGWCSSHAVSGRLLHGGGGEEGDRSGHWQESHQEGRQIQNIFSLFHCVLLGKEITCAPFP